METKDQKNPGFKQRVKNFLCAPGTYGEAPFSAADVLREKKDMIKKVQESVEGGASKLKNGNGSDNP